jgi:hypothetical protein
LLSNVSTEKYNSLISKLVDAWYINNKQLFNKNSAISSIAVIDPTWKTASG